MAVFGWPDLRKLNRVAEEQRRTAASEKSARDHREVNMGILLPENRAKEPRS